MDRDSRFRPSDTYIVAFAVRTRTREFGIRMALGAQREDVLRLVVTQGTRLALVGVAFTPKSKLANRRLESSAAIAPIATDPATYSCATILLFIAGLTACYLPARRATSVDPVQALHSE